MKTKLLVAIDGPAASGKSTVARLVAGRIGGFYVNTGDMYRTITWQARQQGIDIAHDSGQIVQLLSGLELDVRVGSDGRPELLLNGKAVPQAAIRAPEIAGQVSLVAKIPAVRDWLVPRQRATRKLGRVVMEGRDIGTVVFPDADCKFFLTASPEVRAVRRLHQEGETADGATVESVAREIAERDRLDSSRPVAPLRPADDAEVIDSSGMSLEEVVEYIFNKVKGAV
jgi:cytidylate kinase